MPLPLHSARRETLQPASSAKDLRQLGDRRAGAPSQDAAASMPRSAVVLVPEPNASDVPNATLSLSSPPLSIARRLWSTRRDKINII